MQLKPLRFSKSKNRPFLFTSFVGSIDGKIIVKEKGYWPIGSKEDYHYFTFLRAHANAIVDAKNTALQFGKYTIRTIHDSLFQKYQQQIGRTKTPEYIILTTTPDAALAAVLKNEYSFKPTILTIEKVEAAEELRATCNIKHVTTNTEKNHTRVGVGELINYLKSQGHEYVFIDGGPTLIAQLLAADFLDEIHLTIAPKVFGSLPGKTLTMCEGILFPPEKVKKFRLISLERIGDEVL
jgi:5-amino-6-(5-phosphoribosylamino)uracil reductase